MTVRIFRDSWWVDFTVGGRRYRKRSPENSAAGAKSFETVLRSRLARGEDIEDNTGQESPRFADFVKTWFDTYVRSENKPSEQYTKSCILRLHLVPWFGDKTLSSIAPLDIERFKALQRRRGLSAKTVNNHLAALRKCLQKAVDWKVLKEVPKVTMLKTIPPDSDFLTLAESAQLVEAGATEPMWQAMILVALRTGMRLGELCGLEWSAVNFDECIIVVRRSIVRGIVGSPKNHRPRSIPFPASVLEALLPLRKATGLVFHRPDGRPLTQRIAENAIHRTCRRAGLRLIGWHTLRHSCATQLGDLRGNLLEVQRILGHSHITTTEKYAHVVPRHIREAVEELDAAAASEALGNRQATALQHETNQTVVVGSNFSLDKQKHAIEGV